MVRTKENTQAIIITIKNETIVKLGGESMLTDHFGKMNSIDSELYFAYGLANKPLHNVLYCYLLYNGEVRYRFNISHWEPGRRKFDGNGGPFFSLNRKYWMILTASVTHPIRPFPMKGFQGFRYSEVIF